MSEKLFLCVFLSFLILDLDLDPIALALAGVLSVVGEGAGTCTGTSCTAAGIN